ncbi:MAG: hypothetical protein NG737_06580 [Omnitrophica bacterium]|nr:hypothetical protein [Candidatus Omnitrophota bacterium]
MDSPLLFPVRLENNIIYVLDETQIPFKEHYIEVKTIDDALLVLGEMKTRSLGQVLLFFYSCLVFKEFSIDQIIQRFKNRRPTFDFPFLGEILKGGLKKSADAQNVVKGFVYGFDKARRQRAQRLARILPSPANILTICNVNGELVYLHQELEKINKQSFFYVSETRPYLQGTRLTFWELRKNNIPVKVLCDNQAASLMSNKKINCVVTGADRATKNGDVINKIGTYSLARLAKYFNIPFYSLTQYPRDIDVDAIEIEERPGIEAFMYLDGDYGSIDAFYPAFDITKHEFISRCIQLEVLDEAVRN